MKSSVESLIAIKKGFDRAEPILEAMRIKRIRESDILREGPKLDEAFKSAKFLGVTKPMTGLVKLRALLTKMGR